MNVRRLVSGDGAIFGRIRIEALRQEPTSFAADASDYEHYTAADWEALLAMRTAFVAFDRETPIGIASIVPKGLSRLAHRADVTNVYVTPAHRGTGVSHRLWTTLESHALSHGISQLEIGVNAANAGVIRFYKGLGFVRTGLVPNGFRDGDRYFDEILMVKQIGHTSNPA